MRHRRLILALFVLATVITGTAGYSAIQAERSVDVAVADDESAYLAVESHNPSIKNGSTGGALRVTNQFGREIDLSVQEVDTSGSVAYGSLGNSNSEVTLGADDSVQVSVRCNGTSDGGLSVMLFAVGENNELSVRMMQEVDVTCE
ncbi:hypothetical protein [Halorubrum sp. PV6]|uniref:hypothetical protein n=1 Tax=Halorubrum sp. PV6 TaxID=634157 RepID=UPI000F851ED3|nr:hypothetical protein [Halorubrum sp. PV6]AZQ14305.1 hypothetical protein DOS48_05430 [Halorubrum sp. PV6]